MKVKYIVKSFDLDYLDVPRVYKAYSRSVFDLYVLTLSNRCIPFSVSYELSE